MSVFRRILSALAVGCLFAASAPAYAAGEIPGAPDLEDIQIGERDERTRIAIICADVCDLTKRNDTEFLLRGANADFQLDLTGRSQNLAELIAFSAGGGSLLRVTLAREIDYVDAKSCEIGGRDASCIDLFFKETAVAAAPKRPVVAPVKTAQRNVVEKKQPAQLRPSPTPTKKPETTPPPEIRESRIAAAPKPVLRETAPDRLSRFAGLNPPERLAPPAGVVLAKLQPVDPGLSLTPPTIRLKPPVRPLAVGDLSSQVKTILGKDMTADACEVADATLKVDPWALSAMTDVGLCALINGAPEEAEAILSRLLEYTPDNYEAHVGRALIAAQAGERGVARKYFQDALNALPPIVESNRIVEAMNAL